MGRGWDFNFYLDTLPLYKNVTVLGFQKTKSKDRRFYKVLHQKQKSHRWLRKYYYYILVYYYVLLQSGSVHKQIYVSNTIFFINTSLTKYRNCNKHISNDGPYRRRRSLDSVFQNPSTATSFYRAKACPNRYMFPIQYSL